MTALPSRPFSLLAELPPADHHAVLEAARPFDVAIDVNLTVEGDPASGDLLILTEGEAAVSSGGRLVAVRRAPCTIGLVAALDDGARSATVRALTPTRGLRVSGARLRALAAVRPALGLALAQLAARELRSTYADMARTDRMFDDFFMPPDARLVPGPFEGRVDMTVLVMRTSPARTRALLPPRVRPIPGLGGTWLLTLNQFTSMRTAHPDAAGRTFSYEEVTPFLPCLSPTGRPCVFAPELYPDSHLAIVVGRELYGFPKRHARIERGERSLVAAVGGALSMRAAWGNAVPVSQEALWAGLVGEAWGARAGELAGRGVSGAMNLERWWPRLSVLVRRRDRRADELVRIPFRVSEVENPRRLMAPEVRFFTDSPVMHGAPVAGFAQSLTMGFEEGVVAARYRR